MPSYGQLSPEELYTQGLQQFNRADWRGAIASFTQLQAISDQYPDVDALLADAQLKLQFEGAAQPGALPPPRRSLLVPLLAVFALLSVAGGAFGFYYVYASPPPPVVALATSTATPPPPPTATPRLVVPTTAPTPGPTAAPIIPATVLITTEGTFVNTPANIEFIIDASGSMLAKIEGTETERWQVAQAALSSLINSDTISDQAYTVVRTYGRRRGNDCGDLEVAQGLSRYNKESLLNIISTIKPAVGGTTPLGASLRLAAEDLQAAEGSTVVILVTDGLESCNGNPVAEAANFVAGTDQRKVHVIGFALNDPAASANLQQIAEQGNGLYFDAANAAQLVEALRQTIILSYQILDSENNQVASGNVGGEQFQLPPGDYTLKMNANPPLEREFTVKNGDNLVVSLRQGFGGLVATVESTQDD